MRKDLSVLSVLLLVLTLSSCGSGAPGNAEFLGSTDVVVRFDNATAPSSSAAGSRIQALPEDVHRIVLTVSGAGMLIIHQEAEVSPDQESIALSLQVPNGRSRTFQVDAFDAQTPPARIYAGSASVDLNGTPLDIRIVMQRVDSPPLFNGLLAAESAGPVSVSLRWEAASDPWTLPEAMEYLVFLSETPGGEDFEHPVQTVTGLIEADVQDLQPGTTYYFVVRARNQAGSMDANTVERSATTEPQQDTNPPTFDGLQTIEATAPTTVALGWQAATDDVTPPSAIDYLIFVSETPGGQNFTSPIQSVTGLLSTVVPNLEPGTTYYVVVRARDLAGNQETNIVERSATTEPQGDTNPPTFAGLQSAGASGPHELLLQWQSATDDLTPPSAIDYLIFVSETPGGQNFTSPTQSVTGLLSTVVPNLEPGTTYYVVVRARDLAGNQETNTVERSATTEPEPDVNPPLFSGLQSAADSGPTRIQLGWNGATDDVTPSQQIAYLLFISHTPGGQDFDSPDRIVIGQTTTTVQGLQPSTTYHVVVRARDQAGNTETNTVERTATTEPPDTQPPVFAGLQTAAATGPKSVLLGWNAATDNGTPPSAIRYLIFVSQTPGYFDFSTPAKTVAGQVSATILGLEPDHTYYFLIRARDEAGNTETNTVERSATTEPPPDTEPPYFEGLQTAVPSGPFSVSLSWLEATDNVTAPMQIDYLVFVAETPGGQNFNTPDMVVTGYPFTEVYNLDQNLTYYFVVRARDEAGNTEENTVELSATSFTYDKWLFTEPLPVPRLNAVAAAVEVSPENAYVYVINGYTNVDSCTYGTADGRAFFAYRNSDGTLNPWQETTGGNGNFLRSAAGVAQYNGFIYLAGGSINSPNWDGNIWYTHPDTDGSLPWWSTPPYPLPGSPNWVGSWPFVAAHNGYLYVGGGRIDGGVYSDRLYYTYFDINGEPTNNWQQTTLPAPSAKGQLLFHNAKGYLIAGIQNVDGGHTDKVYMADVLGNGALGTWTETTPLPVLTFHPSAQIVSDHLIVIPGGGSSVFVSPINPGDGTLEGWVESDPLPEIARPFDQGIVFDTDYYLIGDQDCSASSEKLTTVRHQRFTF